MFEEPIIIRLDSVDSTSNYAANLLKQTKLPEFSLIVTKRQENGRGQRGTIWHTEPEKNFTGTFIVYPTVPVSSYFVLQKSVAIACLKTIQKFLSDKIVQIKWPNDIYIDGKKTGGILLESQIREKHFEYLLVGIGINVNQEKFNSEILNVTSLSLESGSQVDLADFEQELRGYIQKYLRVVDEKKINDAYYQYLYGYMKWMNFINLKSNEKFEGKIQGVNQQGLLQITNRANENLKFDLKEIAFTHEFLEGDAPYS